MQSLARQPAVRSPRHRAQVLSSLLALLAVFGVATGAWQITHHLIDHADRAACGTQTCSHGHAAMPAHSCGHPHDTKSHDRAACDHTDAHADACHAGASHAPQCAPPAPTAPPAPDVPAEQPDDCSTCHLLHMLSHMTPLDGAPMLASTHPVKRIAIPGATCPDAMPTQQAAARGPPASSP